MFTEYLVVTRECMHGGKEHRAKGISTFLKGFRTEIIKLTFPQLWPMIKEWGGCSQSQLLPQCVNCSSECFRNMEKIFTEKAVNCRKGKQPTATLQNCVQLPLAIKEELPNFSSWNLQHVNQAFVRRTKIVSPRGVQIPQ